MTYEYLSAGPPEPVAAPEDGGAPAHGPRLAPLVVGGLIAAIGLLVLGWLVVDWGLRNAEMRALVTAVEGSEQAMSDTQAAVRAAFEPYSGQGELTDADEEELRDKLSQAAAAGAAGVADGAAAVEAVRILPWHGSLREAREVYLAHNRAWQDYLAAATADPGQFVVPQDAVNSTWEAAEPAMRAALPAPALFDLATRVDLIFADGSEDGQDGGDEGPRVSARGPAPAQQP